MERLIRHILLYSMIIAVVYAEKPPGVIAVDPIYAEIRSAAIEKGIPDYFLKKAFTTETIQTHSAIPDRFARPYEKKSWEEYRKLFVTQRRIEKGNEFYDEHKTKLEDAAQHFNVDPYLILSIIGVESNYGSHHKQFSVFNSLYTQISLMPKRARWAKNEMVEFLAYCYKDNVQPHSVFGSYAGAFGYGQFIPSSFNHYAVDFDNDGVRQAYAWPDVMASIANYLVENGYPVNVLDDQEKDTRIYKAIFAYNHADNYVKAVLALRDELEKTITSKLNK